jgi:ankyrin repeat protein
MPEAMLRAHVTMPMLVAKRNEAGVRWLIARGVDVNAKRVLWDCNTALHITTELTGGAIELTRILLDAGADPNIRDDKYEATVLGWAEFCGQPAIAELLRQRGATT